MKYEIWGVVLTIILPVFLSFLISYLVQRIYSTELEKHLQSDSMKLFTLLFNKGFPIILSAFLISIPMFVVELAIVPTISNLQVVPHFSIQDTNKVFSISSVGKYPINSVEVASDSKRIQPYLVNDNGDSYYLVPNGAKYITFDSKARWKISDLRHKRFTDINDAILEDKNGEYLKSLQVSNSFVDVNKVDGAKYLKATVENTVKVPSLNQIGKSQLYDIFLYAILAVYIIVLITMFMWVWGLIFKNSSLNEYVVMSNNREYEILKTSRGDKLLLEAKELTGLISEQEIKKEYKLISISDLNDGAFDYDGTIFEREVNYSFKDRLSMRLFDKYLKHKVKFRVYSTVYTIISIVLLRFTLILWNHFIQQNSFKFEGISYSTYENLILDIFLLCILTIVTIGFIAVFIKLITLFISGRKKNGTKKNK